MEEKQKLQTLLGYSYTTKILVEGFSPSVYSNIMKIENTHYVYDKDGIMLSMICAPTKSKAIWECKKYIILKKYNLVPLIHFFNDLLKRHENTKISIKSYFQHYFRNKNQGKPQDEV